MGSRVGKTWTKGEISDLYEIFNNLSNKELEMHFKRNYTGIYKKARKLNIRRSAEREFRNRSEAKSGGNCNFWKGGRRTTKAGYVQILNKSHHRACVGGYVMEHILVAENKLGRKIRTDEAVHHINGVKSDNRPENLKVMDFGEHTKLHHIGSKRSERTKTNIRIGKQKGRKERVKYE